MKEKVTSHCMVRDEMPEAESILHDNLVKDIPEDLY